MNWCLIEIVFLRANILSLFNKTNTHAIFLIFFRVRVWESCCWMLYCLSLISIDLYRIVNAGNIIIRKRTYDIIHICRWPYCTVCCMLGQFKLVLRNKTFWKFSLWFSSVRRWKVDFWLKMNGSWYGDPVPVLPTAEWYLWYYRRSSVGLCPETVCTRQIPWQHGSL